MRPLVFVLISLIAPLLHAVSLQVGTLNCYLCFDPAVEHAGKVDDANKLSESEYRQKIQNLAGLAKGCEVVGVQEVGGSDEIAALAKGAGLEYAFVPGKDTFTGENVALLFRLPAGWRLQRAYRHPGLESLSKHLVCDFSDGKERFSVVVFHLIRPIGKNAEKHAQQIAALEGFASTHAPGFPRPILFLGDANSRERKAIFPVAADASALTGYAPTHIDRQSYDRMMANAGRFSDAIVARPPYGTRPSRTNVRLWSDHFLFSAKWDSQAQ